MPSHLSTTVALLRGALKRCPRCGGGGLFTSWFKLKSRCPSCDLDFDREPGWWIGAIIMNTGVAQVLFFAYMGLSLWLTWPEVPWVGLTVGAAVLMVAFPVFFYPFSKTIWLGVDLLLHQMDESVGVRPR